LWSSERRSRFFVKPTHIVVPVKYALEISIPENGFEERMNSGNDVKGFWERADIILNTVVVTERVSINLTH